ncbi:NITRATE FORMATE IRON DEHYDROGENASE [Salix koriyanagi]|uniref:CASP-like protein n=1 Tax=Salix koriyanagi TaxID=2511006 RepID=A0A9Q1APG3_9ROSI|nr:NITRATE FORMATE IRON DEHYDROGENASE [Salix koriyanagi]
MSTRVEIPADTSAAAKGTAPLIAVSGRGKGGIQEGACYLRRRFEIRFFVIAMAMVSGYLVLSLPFSIVAIIRPRAAAPRLLLIILDTVALTLNMAAAGAATAIALLSSQWQLSSPKALTDQELILFS